MCTPTSDGTDELDELFAVTILPGDARYFSTVDSTRSQSSFTANRSGFA